MKNVDPRITEIDGCLYRLTQKIAVIENQKLLVTYEPEGWYSLPGGGAEFGEDLRQGLFRELSEEVGLVPEDLEVDQMPSYLSNSGLYNGLPRLCLIYKARLLNKNKLRARELSYDWFDAKQLENNPLSPSIEASKTYLLSIL
jgi:8-oxo-dGTP pyrophosphatase MutT (NUDIX family)